jgi:hypothetical protein
MKKPETIWVLPHRDQSGDEDVVKDGQFVKLTAALPVEQLPKELVLGIPESVLREHPEEDLIFGQYVRQPREGRALFALSVTCGKDKGGRTVYLTLLEILGLKEKPQLQPPTEGLPDRERHKADKLRSRFGNPMDKWVRRVNEMLDVAEGSTEIDSFSSVSIPDAAFPPQWNPEKKKLYGRSR